MKKLAPIISPVICDIYNSAIIKGIFPSILKLSRVIPLHKGKSNKITNNFRPIFLLPFMSKVIEKLFKSRVCKFIENNSILYKKQFGFRTGCNTSDAILHLVHDCVTALDDKLFTVTVFLDFSKAFDTVNKDIMLKKLHRLGFRDNINKFIRSYLTDRRMFVSVNNCESTIRTTNIGLPQGSVSAPWLFSLYINDMHNISDKLKFSHFADDTVVYMTGNNLKSLCRDLCNELIKVDDWLKTNRLSLNIDKTYFMVLTHNTYDINNCIIKIRDKSINYVTETKFLGVILDNKLNYNSHVTKLTKQLSRVKGILFKLANTVPPFILRNLYYSLFYSRMTYAISVWGGGNKININKVIECLPLISLNGSM